MSSQGLYTGPRPPVQPTKMIVVRPAILLDAVQYSAAIPGRLARPPCCTAPAPLVGVTAHFGVYMRYAVHPATDKKIIQRRRRLVAIPEQSLIHIPAHVAAGLDDPEGIAQEALHRGRGRRAS